MRPRISGGELGCCKTPVETSVGQDEVCADVWADETARSPSTAVRVVSAFFMAVDLRALWQLPHSSSQINTMTSQEATVRDAVSDSLFTLADLQQPPFPSPPQCCHALVTSTLCIHFTLHDLPSNRNLSNSTDKLEVWIWYLASSSSGHAGLPLTSQFLYL